jgi:hypothetical protein
MLCVSEKGYYGKCGAGAGKRKGSYSRYRGGDTTENEGAVDVGIVVGVMLERVGGRCVLAEGLPSGPRAVRRKCLPKWATRRWNMSNLLLRKSEDAWTPASQQLWVLRTPKGAQKRLVENATTFCKGRCVGGAL